MVQRRKIQQALQPVATIQFSSPTVPPLAKMAYLEFPGEPGDWSTWSKVYLAQLSALGCRRLKCERGRGGNSAAAPLTGTVFPPSSCVTRIRCGSDLSLLAKVWPSRSFQDRRLPASVWANSFNTSEPEASRAVWGSPSPSITMGMRLGKRPGKLALQVDRMVQELEHAERLLEPKDVEKVILSRLTS